MELQNNTVHFTPDEQKLGGFEASLPREEAIAIARQLCQGSEMWNDLGRVLQIEADNGWNQQANANKLHQRAEDISRLGDKILKLCGATALEVPDWEYFDDKL